MASNPIGREAQPVTLPGMIPPMPAVARILSRYDRGKLSAFVAVAIDLLDVLDGDPDTEPSGDETDAAWPELHGVGCPKALRFPTEDSEDDDPAGACDEDGINTGQSRIGMHGLMDDGPGCPISDPGEYEDGY